MDIQPMQLKGRITLASVVAVLVGLASDAQILALLPEGWSVIITKAILYGMGGGILYNMDPKKGDQKP